MENIYEKLCSVSDDLRLIYEKLNGFELLVGEKTGDVKSVIKAIEESENDYDAIYELKSAVNALIEFETSYSEAIGKLYDAYDVFLEDALSKIE